MSLLKKQHSSIYTPFFFKRQALQKWFYIVKQIDLISILLHPEDLPPKDSHLNLTAFI